MGVPRPCSFDPSCSLEIKGSCYTDSMNTIIEQPLQSMPQTSALQSQPQTPLVCSPNKFSYLNSTEALYATTETVHSGGSVEMWYFCRLLCPRHQCKNIKDSVLQQVDLPEGVVSGAGPDLKRGHTEVTMDPGDDEDERDDLGQNTDEDLAKNSTSRFKDDTSCRNEEDITYTRVINKSNEESDGLKEQLAMVQTMVQEMKLGFIAALDQLTAMQDGDQGTWHKIDSNCKQQEQQLTDFTQTLTSLQSKIADLSSSVTQVVNTQQLLMSMLVCVQNGHKQLLTELFSAGVLSQESRNILFGLQETMSKGKHVDLINIPVDRNQSSAGPCEVIDDIHQPCSLSPLANYEQGERSHVTAAACKSLSLTQELAARCQDIDISESSEEDLESAVSRHIHSKHVEEKKGYMMQGKSITQAILVDSAQRRQAVEDIIESEQEYCSQLLMLMNTYEQPLQEGHYMSSRQLNILFPSSLSDMCEQHRQMLHLLQDRLLHWSSAGVVGDIFARVTNAKQNLLGLYQEYVESLPASISCLRHHLTQSRSLRTFIKAKKELNPNADLMSLLICPLQRIPKYMLQLQQVLRYTHKDHPDHFRLQTSLSKLQDFVERFNHDISHTAQAISLDGQAQGSSVQSSVSGSSCEVGLVTGSSTVDSGVHSTGEDTASGIGQHNIHASSNMYLPKWLEQSSGYLYDDIGHVHLEPFHHSTRLASHSQPDLSYSGYPAHSSFDTYTGYPFHSSFDPQATIPQIRSQSTLPPTAEYSARQRRYKIRKRIEGQGYSPAPFSSNCSVLDSNRQCQSQYPHLRPTSAIDFASQKEILQRQGRDQMTVRPRSVLARYPGHTRVVHVYSRKQSKVDDILDTTPNNLGPSNASSNTPLHRRHVKASLHPQVVLNECWDPLGGGDRERVEHAPMHYDVDDEDDTKATGDSHLQYACVSPKKDNSWLSQDNETDNSDLTHENLAEVQNGPAIIQDSHDTTLSPYSCPQSTTTQLHSKGLKEEGSLNDSVDKICLAKDISCDSETRLTLNMPELKLDLDCIHDNDSNGYSSHHKTSLHTSKFMPSPALKELVTKPEDNLNQPPVNKNTNNPETPSRLAESFQERQVLESAKPPSSEKVNKIKSFSPVIKEGLLTVNDSSGQVVQRRIGNFQRQQNAAPSRFVKTVDRIPLPQTKAPAECISSSDVADSLYKVKAAEVSKKPNKGSNHVVENFNHSIEDMPLSASKKKPFRTSLKNLFNKKKGSVILDDLEREYTKELVRMSLAQNGHSFFGLATASSNTTSNLNTNTKSSTFSPSNDTCVTTTHDSTNDRNNDLFNLDPSHQDDPENFTSSIQNKECNEVTSNTDSINNNIVHCTDSQGRGLFANLRRSPLFFINGWKDK